MTAKRRQLQASLLQWYSKHQRVMPWRAVKGRTPDPYHIWLSEIMLQQTTVVTVGPYFMKFIKKWPTVKKLAAAGQEEVLAAWAGLGYYARARNLHKCAQVIAKELNGIFPSSPEELMKLPGIGPYTAAAVSSIAFNKPAVAVDGNVERVVSRFFAIEEPLPLSKEKIRAGAQKLAKDNPQPGDFTQAFMELGATICTPRNPKCGLCPWHSSCKSLKLGIAEDLPRKTAKASKPTRYGQVFWMQNKAGAFLIEKQTAKGLYEGMYMLPTTNWAKHTTTLQSLFPKGRKPLNITVRHSFTHFDLVLEIWKAAPPKKVRKSTEKFIFAAEADHHALPSLMRKVVQACLKAKIA